MIQWPPNGIPIDCLPAAGVVLRWLADENFDNDILRALSAENPDQHRSPRMSAWRASTRSASGVAADKTGFANSRRVDYTATLPSRHESEQMPGVFEVSCGAWMRGPSMTFSC